MDPFTAYLIGQGASVLLGLNWDKILNGDKYSNDGYHGLSLEQKQAVAYEIAEQAFKFCLKDPKQGKRPVDYFWLVMEKQIIRPDEKPFSGWVDHHKWFPELVQKPLEAKYGFGFFEVPTSEKVLKIQINELFKNPYLLYGAIGLVALWIISIVLKITKK